MRIVSTVPSQTELLSYLGLDDSIVGITKFCIHPEHIYRSVQRIGGTKELDLEAIRQLKPDLIIANKEENVKEQIEELKQEFKVYVSDVHDLDSALLMIHEVGALVNSKAKGDKLSNEIKHRFNALKSIETKEVLYLIWPDPYMSVGHDTYIHNMLERCGLKSVTSRLERYPEVQAGAFDPEVILLSSEPFPFKERHMALISSAWPKAQIRLVEGEYFSWYGPRMLGALDYFEKEITLPHRQ